jgi:hypothetical protein
LNTCMPYHQISHKSSSIMITFSEQRL